MYIIRYFITLMTLYYENRIFQILFSILNIYELLPRTINDILLKIGPEICKQGILREICANVLFLVGGYDSEQMDRVSVHIIQY